MSNKNFLSSSDILNFIDSEQFIQNLDSFCQNDFFLYNKILTIYYLYLSFNTTGIKEAGANLSYYQVLSPEVENFLRPNPKFYFFTTKNKLIENSSYCSRSFHIMKNKLFVTKNGLDFKNKIFNLFQDNSKPINKTNFFDSTFSFRVYKKKKNETNRKDEFYFALLDQHPFIISCIESIILEKTMCKKQTTLNTIKL